jgi:hypothetical protein
VGFPKTCLPLLLRYSSVSGTLSNKWSPDQRTPILLPDQWDHALINFWPRVGTHHHNRIETPSPLSAQPIARHGSFTLTSNLERNPSMPALSPERYCDCGIATIVHFQKRD